MGIMKAWILCMPARHRPASGAGLDSWFLWNRSVISARPVPGRGRTARWFSACHGISTSGWCGPPRGWPSIMDAHLICAFVDPASYLTEWEPAGSQPGASLDPVPNVDAEFPAWQMLAGLEGVLGPPGGAWSFRVLNGEVAQALGRLAESADAAALIVGGQRPGRVAKDGPAPGRFRQRFPDPPAGQARADRSARGARDPPAVPRGQAPVPRPTTAVQQQCHGENKRGSVTAGFIRSG